MSVLDSTILTSVAGQDNQFIAGAVGVAAIFGTAVIYYTLSPKDKERDFPKLRGVQLYHAWNFFRRRHDFIESNFEKTPGRSFSFNVLHHNVVALTGEDAREAFFSNPHLDLGQGYRILMGTVPRVSDVDITVAENEERDSILFKKRLNKILSGARMRDALPKLLQDIVGKADRWVNDGKAGRIDPFTELYDLVFATTARLTTCRDLIKNEADLNKAKELLLTMQANITPISSLLPWLPSPASKTRDQATSELCAILYAYTEGRRNAEPTSDTIDLLIADGETSQNIVGFIIRALFTGISSTSSVLFWTLIDLAIHQEWREKCKKEIQDLLSHHLGDSSPATMYERLGTIPISAWEDELPTLTACARESHRMVVAGVTLRRNVREEIEIGGRVIKRGDFLAYSLNEVHQNPKYYPEPNKYDPGRWLRPDPVPNAPYPFLGWGGGRHPCLGMKVAKLEMKLTLATFLIGYEFDLVDKDGKFPDPLPVPDKNDIHRVPPLGATYYLNLKKVLQ